MFAVGVYFPSELARVLPSCPLPVLTGIIILSQIAAFLINLFIYLFIFILMCIQCLGHFSPLPPGPIPHPRSLPHFQTETVLPLSLILLKIEYKH
jgi:hypothetical protein